LVGDEELENREQIEELAEDIQGPRIWEWVERQEKARNAQQPAQPKEETTIREKSTLQRKIETSLKIAQRIRGRSWAKIGAEARHGQASKALREVEQKIKEAWQRLERKQKARKQEHGGGTN
jgi:hypothetical protein